MTEDNNINRRGEQPIYIVPTLGELAVLMRHSLSESIKLQYFLFWGQSTGSSDFQQYQLIRVRQVEIGKILSDEVMNKAVEETYEQAAQDLDQNTWTVYCYGTPEERAAYQQMGGPALKNFPEGVADRLASQVIERVYNEAPVEEQMKLLKEELMRYSRKLDRVYRSGPIVDVFGVSFPAEVKRLVLSIGIEDPTPDSPDTFFETLTLEQGRAIVAALAEVVRQSDSLLKDLLAHR